MTITEISLVLLWLLVLVTLLYLAKVRRDIKTIVQELALLERRNMDYLDEERRFNDARFNELRKPTAL